LSTNAQAVLLLAGEGTRLRPHTLDRPKCLVEVGGRPLLDRALASIEAAGIPGVVLVTGYRSEMIDAFLAARASKATVVTVKNEAYASTNNAFSLACARKAVDRPFLLLDGDLLFEPAVMTRLLASQGEAVLAVEKRKTLGAEEMKVILDERGTIAAVNKEVDPAAAIGEAIGIARFGTTMIDKLFDRLEAQIAEGRRNIFYEKAFEELIAAGEPFNVADVSGLACMEIDTPEDLEAARSLAQRIQPLPARLAAP